MACDRSSQRYFSRRSRNSFVGGSKGNVWHSHPQAGSLLKRSAPWGFAVGCGGSQAHLEKKILHKGRWQGPQFFFYAAKSIQHISMICILLVNVCVSSSPFSSAVVQGLCKKSSGEFLFPFCLATRSQPPGLRNSSSTEPSAAGSACKASKAQWFCEGKLEDVQDVRQDVTQYVRPCRIM